MKLTPLNLSTPPKQKALAPTPVVFAGEGSETADMSTLARAREMYSEESVKEVPDFKRIWKETGWFKNPLDNKWRYEISDKGATFVDGKFSHPELEKAYPNIFKDYTFKVEKYDEGGLRGYHDPNEKVISVSASSSPEEQLSTMVHEFQHAIQTKEGMAKGGSSISLEAMYTRNSRHPEWVKSVEDVAEVAERKDEFWKTRPKWNPPNMEDSGVKIGEHGFKDAYNKYRDNRDKYEKEYNSEIDVFEAEWDSLVMEWNEKLSFLHGVEAGIANTSSSSDLYKAYKRFGGEAEARAVQLRMGGEFDNIYPLLTYDIQAYKQVKPEAAMEFKDSIWGGREY